MRRRIFSGSPAIFFFMNNFTFQTRAFLLYYNVRNKNRKIICKEAEKMKIWTKEERYRVLKSAEEIRSLHEHTVTSDYRQHYHIQSVTGLLNDPNVFVYHKGAWHLFYQWCPWGAVHGLKYWYHTISEDLVTWKNAGSCIRPDTFYDNKGAYSGSALPTDDCVYLYYTGNHRDEDWKRSSYTCLVKLDDHGNAQKLEHLSFCTF